MSAPPWRSWPTSAATGRVARQEAETYLLRLYDALQPQQEGFVWVGWQLAISLLGLETMSGVVRQAFGRGLIDPMVTNYDHFREDLGRTIADPERMAGLNYDRIAPLEDAIGELSGWYAFSDAFKRDQERRAADTAWARLAPSAASTLDRPAQECRPERSCPCGSGKKFKKCCLQ